MSIKEAADRIRENVARAVVGKDEAIELCLVALLCEGHVLLEDVPGIGKTTLAKALARSVGCSFKRIQFTPDLLPSDVTGLLYFNQKTHEFEFRPGPIMAQIVLADEINRATPRTQSALLEAMQEAQVTIEGDTRLLEPPFMVLATQNPIEHEGTYPLPEAQVDRFLLKLAIRYPEVADEKRILLTYNQPAPEVRAVLDPQRILALQQLAEMVHVDDELMDYIIGLARFTRQHRRVYLGVSPRASLMLLHASKARALIRGRAFVLPDDIKSLAIPVLAHRVLLAPEAELEGIRTEEVVAEALEKVRYQNRR